MKNVFQYLGLQHKKFLKNLEYLKRAEIISKRLPFSKKQIFYRLNKLINKNFMGEVFKSYVLTKNKEIQTWFLN